MNQDRRSDLKTCSRCGNEKSGNTEYFFKHKNAKDGLQPFCKECARAATLKTAMSGTPEDHIRITGDYCEVTVSDGIVKISYEDIDLIKQYHWQLWNTKCGRKYAKVMLPIEDGSMQIIQMHRLIMGAQKGQQVDHINGDSQDNRRCNLRLCDQAGNSRNSRKMAGTTSRYRGVSLHRGTGKWVVYICANRKMHYLGLFADEEEAARVYDTAAKHYHGEFASLNFPDAPSTGSE